MAVKQLGSSSTWNLALQERNAMEAVKEKKYALPFYGLHRAGALSPDASEETHTAQDAFFVMG